MKEQLLKQLEYFKGKSPVFCTLCGAGLVFAIVVGIYSVSIAESYFSGPGGNNFGSPSDKGQLVLRKQTIRDNNLGMNSHSIYVPEGWKMKGETKWFHQNFYRAWPSPQVSITSPEGLAANIYQVQPFTDPRPSAQLAAHRPQQGQSYEGLPVFYRPESNNEWKRLFEKSLIPERHPNASNIKVTKVGEEEAFTKGLENVLRPLIASIQQKNNFARQSGISFNMKTRIKGLIIESTFTENGIEKECISLIGLYSLEIPFPGYVKINWTVAPDLSFVAPKGQLEANLPKMITILSTLRPSLAWNQKVHKIFTPNTPAPTSNKSTTNVGQIYSDMIEGSHKSYRERQGLRDKGQSAYVNSIHEITPYSHNGNQYQLPSGYNHVYTNDYDTIVLTNDSLLKPNVDIGGSHEWSKMTTR